MLIVLAASALVSAAMDPGDTHTWRAERSCHRHAGDVAAGVRRGSMCWIDPDWRVSWMQICGRICMHRSSRSECGVSNVGRHGRRMSDLRAAAL